jgi:3-hydroxyisobutyrate dehydrogenase
VGFTACDREQSLMRVAFLGLGAIGRPMAAHLAARDSLTVWNRTSERAREFAATHGAVAGETPREAAANAEVVITCLPTSREVEMLLEGPDGLEQGLTPGALLIDCTSGDPATCRRIARRLAERGVSFADAPVSGGVSGAEAGTLTIMVGADAETYNRARVVLSAFGKRIEHLGPVGAGHAMKAVNNALLAVNLIALGEGLTGLVKAGVSARTAVDVLNASSGRSFASESLVPERVLTGRWPQTFRLALLDKDVGIALTLLKDSDMLSPLLEVAGGLLASARAELGESADHVEVIRWIEHRAGVQIRG